MRSQKTYSIVKVQSIRDPDFGLEEIINMTKTISINHSEKSSVPKKSQELCRKVGNNRREPTTIGRESAMTIVIFTINVKRRGIKRKSATG